MNHHIMLATFTAGMMTLITSCASPEEIAATRQRQAEADSQVCRSYGLRPGSEAFGNCRLQLDLERQRAYEYRDPYYYGGYYGGPRVGSGIYFMR